MVATQKKIKKKKQEKKRKEKTKTMDGDCWVPGLDWGSLLNQRGVGIFDGISWPSQRSMRESTWSRSVL